MKIANYILKGINYFLLWILVVLVTFIFFCKYFWGNVSFTQLAFFICTNTEDVDGDVIGMVVACVGLFPIWLLMMVYLASKKIQPNNKPYLPMFPLVVVCCLVYYVVKKYIYLSEFEYWVVQVLLVGGCWFNLRKNYSSIYCLITLILLYPMTYEWLVLTKNDSVLQGMLHPKETTYYAENYVDINALKLENPHKRNLIVIYGESLQKEFLQNEFVQIKDAQALKFDDFQEGFVQRWTQAALFSSFTGTHIHYLSDFLRYKFHEHFSVMINKNIDELQKTSLYANNSGTMFDFKTPNIAVLSRILADNGYENLFVQGGSLEFSGSRNFLEYNGFKPENIVDMYDFADTEDEKKRGKWWGVSDNVVFPAFKKKIAERDKSKPFLAVMFTMDTHFGENPYYKDFIDIEKTTVRNLEDFVTWFEAQDFYKDTTLVILADHRRMLPNAQPGGSLYNAFYNVPNAEKINIHRSFNQIDMFPTLLELAGFVVPNHKAGLGTSLLSNEKTLAEKFTYDEQVDLLQGRDEFYIHLWDKELHKEVPFRHKIINDKKEKIISHAFLENENKSLRNLEEAVQQGFKYVELDLLKTDDNRLIYAHDFGSVIKYKIDFSSANKLSDYKIGYDALLYDDLIAEFFENHPELYMVTDKVDDFDLMEEKFGKFKNRVIVEVFSDEKYAEAKQKGWPYVVQNIKGCVFDEKNISEVEDEFIVPSQANLMTIDLKYARKHAEEIKMLRQDGKTILLYPLRTMKEIEENSDIGDIFYYDGLEKI